MIVSLACVTGRFQPVHNGHLELFRIALEDHDRLVLAVTNPDLTARSEEPTAPHRHLDDANPFTYFERYELLMAAASSLARSADVSVVPFDLTRPEVWANYVPLSATQFVRIFGPWEETKARRLEQAGYQVRTVAGDLPSKVQSTAIREAWRVGESWSQLVPGEVASVLSKMLP